MPVGDSSSECAVSSWWIRRKKKANRSWILRVRWFTCVPWCWNTPGNISIMSPWRVSTRVSLRHPIFFSEQLYFTAERCSEHRSDWLFIPKHRLLSNATNSIWLTFGIMVGGSFGFEMVRIIVNGVQSYRISDLINFCNTQSHQKNCFWKEIYQGAKLSLQRSLSSHRNHESLPFHFCHEIPSSRLPKDSSIPSRSSNRRSHTSRIHQNFSKKGKLWLYPSCLRLCTRNQSLVGTKVHIPVLAIWIWTLLLF